MVTLHIVQRESQSKANEAKERERVRVLSACVRARERERAGCGEKQQPPADSTMGSKEQVDRIKALPGNDKCADCGVGGIPHKLLTVLSSFAPPPKPACVVVCLGVSRLLLTRTWHCLCSDRANLGCHATWHSGVHRVCRLPPKPGSPHLTGEC